MTEDTGLEKHLGITNTELSRIQLNMLQNLAGGGLCVRKSFGDDASSQDGVTLLEVREDHSVRESLTTNTDTLQHTITGQLVHNQVSIHNTGLFHFVGDDATDEMGMGGLQSSHQFTQLFTVQGGHCHETGTLFTLTTCGNNQMITLSQPGKYRP